MKKTVLLIFLFALFLGGSSGIQAGTVTDSLLAVLKSAQHDSTKCRIMLELGTEIRPENPDSAHLFFDEAFTKAVNRQKMTDLNPADRKVWKSLEIQSRIELGKLLLLEGKHSEALEHFYTGMKLSQEEGNLKRIASMHLWIGRVYRLQWVEKIDQGVEEIKKGLEICRENDFYEQMAYIYMELGATYADGIWKKANPETAIKYLDSAIQIGIAHPEFGIEAPALSRMGYAYINSNNPEKAFSCFDRAMELYRAQNDISGIYVCYRGTGTVNEMKEEYDLAIEFYKKALDMADKMHNVDGMNNICESISECYSKLGKPDLALEFYKKSVEYKFLVYDEQRLSELARMETLFETEKKNSELKLKDAEIKKQNLKQIALIIGLGLFFVLAIVIFISYRQKKKANALLSAQKLEIVEKNEELKLQNEEIASQRDEIESQRDLLSEQKHQIEIIHESQTDSIRYAKRIQKALLYRELFAQTIEWEHFVLFMPRDIVSGDFYFARNIPAGKLVAVGDCTGHGVPGAFMSMMSITFLNEIVMNPEMNNPAIILETLREKVIAALHQQEALLNTPCADVCDSPARLSEVNSVKDGLDISLCIIQPDTLKMQYAGANNQAWILRNYEEIIELKPNKMPIAIHLKMEPFTNQNIQMLPGDELYLFSDGFADQFGGSEGKKYYSRRFRETILHSKQLAMAKKEELLKTEILAWMNDYQKQYPQIDDITVAGIKIPEKL